MGSLVPCTLYHDGYYAAPSGQGFLETSGTLGQSLHLGHDGRGRQQRTDGRRETVSNPEESSHAHLYELCQILLRCRVQLRRGVGSKRKKKNVAFRIRTKRREKEKNETFVTTFVFYCSVFCNVNETKNSVTA